MLDYLMRILVIAGILVVLLYLVYFGYFFAMQRTILFPYRYIPPAPAVANLPPGGQQIWFDVEQARVEAWYLPPLEPLDSGRAPLFIVGHGNGEIIDSWRAPAQALRQAGFAVLLVEYPGYGRSTGVPTERSITAAFVAAYDWVIEQPEIDPQRIVLFGHSVGGGAVSALAAQRPSAALILFSTFSSVRALAAAQGLPSFAVRDPFDNLAVVRNYPNPVLVIHGEWDRTIPYSHGLALHAAAPQGALVTLPCGHNGCVSDWASFWQQLRPFFQHAGVIPVPSHAGNRMFTVQKRASI
jgi:uncharacterized protein